MIRRSDMKATRNKYLGPSMYRVLRALADDVKCDLVREGGAVWYGYSQTSVSVLNSLLRLCLVSPDGYNQTGGGYERYEINEDGRAVLQDPNYVPRILRVT